MEQAMKDISWRSAQEYDGVLGTPPSWVPQNFQSEFSSIRNKLINSGHSVDDLHFYIKEVTDINNISVANTESDDPPVFRPRTPFDIWSEVTTLAFIQKAVQLGEEQGLILLIGEPTATAAIQGKKFTTGRKPNTGGPIRKKIAALLAKNPSMKNPQLWEKVIQKLPKGWSLVDGRRGAWLDGPTAADHMTKRRFETICGEERKKLKQ